MLFNVRPEFCWTIYGNPSENPRVMQNCREGKKYEGGGVNQTVEELFASFRASHSNVLKTVLIIKHKTFQ